VGNRHVSEIVRQPGLAVMIAENRSLELNGSGLDTMHRSELIRGDVMISPSALQMARATQLKREARYIPYKTPLTKPRPSIFFSIAMS
jgi:hypothetical protein